MRKLFPFLCGIGFLVYSLGFCAASPVQAGIFDKVKDIYNMPDKLNELQDQYDEAAQKLSEQQQKLLDMQRYSEELALKNSELTKQLEQMSEERASLKRNAVGAAAIVAGLIAAYILSIRLWRYSAWRKQKQHNGGMFGS
ncbi:hypothetical protein N0M98_19375 [Paenibacillus doosanensis]|uniref:Uncharacterized protein n=1 Tax=Paenibacillus konkukensis TaxID=2020716 RepID=A0ABY4RE97_9BACL|nr:MULTISPECIES: hypothetical protein [Paenibacillus]MCS7462306.1 hypothetical protein [Paenibacillus doosanensis]UQZ80882.1 hypothetical protein SK3146_00038 [Paenibacillus konkukensis]